MNSSCAWAAIWEKSQHPAPAAAAGQVGSTRCGDGSSTAVASARAHRFFTFVSVASTVSPGIAPRTNTTRPSGASAMPSPPCAMARTCKRTGAPAATAGAPVLSARSAIYSAADGVSPPAFELPPAARRSRSSCSCFWFSTFWAMICFSASPRAFGLPSAGACAEAWP